MKLPINFHTVIVENVANAWFVNMEIKYVPAREQTHNFIQIFIILHNVMMHGM